MNRLQQLVDDLADELRRPAGVDDRRFRALAYSAHPDDVDPVRLQSILRREAPQEIHERLRSYGIESAEAAVRIPAMDEFEMVARVCVPLRYHGALLGYLWITDTAQDLVDEGSGVLESYASQMAEALWRDRLAAGDERLYEETAVRSLINGDDPARAGARWQQLGRATATAYTCLVLLPQERLTRSTAEVRLTAAVDGLRRGVAYQSLAAAVSADEAVLILAHDDPAEPLRRASALRDSALRQTPGQVIVGVGGSRPALDAIAGSADEARHAARVIAALGDGREVAAWDDLGAYRTISSLAGGRTLSETMPSGLQRLLADPDADLLIRTLEIYLDHAGDVQASAAALFVHRSSLYNRLRRAEEVAQVDLRSGDDRLELHLGIRLLRLGDGWRAAQR